jgi:hypothetical protein
MFPSCIDTDEFRCEWHGDLVPVSRSRLPRYQPHASILLFPPSTSSIALS